MKRSAFDESRDQRIADEPKVRTDYSCRAHGCPNAGSMEGEVCFFHHRDPVHKWSETTQEIRENFDRMRNWGTYSAERQAKHRATSQKLFGQTGRNPTGLQGVDLGELAA